MGQDDEPAMPPGLNDTPAKRRLLRRTATCHALHPTIAIRKTLEYMLKLWTG